MAFRQLDYQTRVLDTLDLYLSKLKAEQVTADEIEKLAVEKGLPLDVPDPAAKAWEALKAEGRLPASRANIPFSPRHTLRRDADGNLIAGRPVPNVTLKVPTGGGKTFLAAHGVSRILGRYLGTLTGFVLWIVPNEAIYTQTKATLSNPRHPYRQAIDRASGYRTKILEKNDRLDRRDTDSHLCIMLLMLQSSNRQNKESLKIFQDRGNVHGFTPDEGDQDAHRDLLKRIPNLSAYDLADSPAAWPMVKDSLGNALRILRPVVVMDEGQKAVSDLAYETLYGFNPSFVLELSATPKDVKAKGGKNPKPARYANLLVEVMGKELDDEGMIKMPLNVDARQRPDWQGTLQVALDRLDGLQRDASTFRADTGRYIRPIMLIQVERTGKDQRGAGHIHSEDVKEWLMAQAGFDEAEIAIKTAEKNDLSDPENLDLLSPTNRVRVIITKAALQEGWDCPFAYVLCSLSASSNESAMTQLVGRILRQPQALKTGVDSLDECYVVAHHADTGAVVAAIKKGLEQDGLGDLILTAAMDDGTPVAKVARKLPRRDSFKGLRIFLPKVLWVEGEEVRDFDYETDLLSRIDWRDYDPSSVAARISSETQIEESGQVKIDLTDGGDGELISQTPVKAWREAIDYDPAYIARIVSDIVPNPFVGRAIVGRLEQALMAKGIDRDTMGGLMARMTTELRKALTAEQLDRAEGLFKADVAAERIQFRLRVDDHNWRMPDHDHTLQPDGAPQLPRKDGGAIEKSLFTPVYRDDLNSKERDVAVYLDADKTLTWWHRNVARQQYGLPGWRRGKVYPDFIFASLGSAGPRRLTVLETKGNQLDGNLDTTYKRELLKFLTDSFALGAGHKAGELELVTEGGETVECALIVMSDYVAELDRLMGKDVT